MIKSAFHLSLMALLASCAGKRESGHPVADQLKPRYFFDAISGGDSYASLFEKNTQEDRVHSEFQPVIRAYATLWDSNLREAYIRERAGRFRLTEDAEKALALEELSENEAYTVFVVSVYTREFTWNQLDRKDGMWRVSLESPDGKKRFTPERIEVISQKDEVARYFYKYMDNFSRTYRIRFPNESLRDLEQLKLHISGVRGSVSFAFERLKGRP